MGCRVVTLLRQVPPRRRFAGGLLTLSWWWAVGGGWWHGLVGPGWWLGWAVIVGSGMALTVVQARRTAAWWRRQTDLEDRRAAVQAAARGRVYVSGRRSWVP